MENVLSHTETVGACHYIGLRCRCSGVGGFRLLRVGALPVEGANRVFQTATRDMSQKVGPKQIV